MLTYKEGSIFDHVREHNTLLVHACNCQGMWGSGVAKQFAEKYPEDYQQYKQFCKDYYPLKHCFITRNNIGCLFTSDGYGKNVDSPDQIIYNTIKAVDDLVNQTREDQEIVMPKINSGLFNVPWERTEAILKNHDRNFIVYTIKETK